MSTPRRPSIDNLGIAGSERSEEHLSLASGGLINRINWTYPGTGPCYIDNSCQVDVIEVEGPMCD